MFTPTVRMKDLKALSFTGKDNKMLWAITNSLKKQTKSLTIKEFNGIIQKTLI